MRNTYSQKATVCTGNNCVTVHGNAAKVVTALTIGTVAFLFAKTLAKALQK